jgi:8-oxo-dGTP pyrophosphatase MutT (NUDIX family)
MYIKIYFGDKPLFLCDSITPEIEPYLHHDDAVFIDEFSTPALKSMIFEMELKRIHAGILQHNDLNALRKAFWKKFEVVKAGGGAVWNMENSMLFIHRRGKWDLPKGKLDPGETIESCAVREVEEETGLQNPVITKHLLNTYHTYYEAGKHILKETYWYEMNVQGEQKPTPQIEEDIHAIEWFPKDEWKQVLDNTFPSIRDVLQIYLPK